MCGHLMRKYVCLQHQVSHIPLHATAADPRRAVLQFAIEVFVFILVDTDRQKEPQVTPTCIHVLLQQPSCIANSPEEPIWPSAKRTLVILRGSIAEPSW